MLHSFISFKIRESLMKKIIFALAITTLLSACSDNEVGDVSLGMFTMKDIKISNLDDEKIPGVTCHIASVEANLSLSDPSDSSISCRQTGEITPEMIAQIDRSKSGEVVFKQSKSIFFKSMKVRRIYDAENQTLLYLSYTTKETEGSFKHSLSTVPLWGTKAYVEQPVTAN
ncbi:conserved CreA protein [Aliivibrio fischeri ES114]|uniref:Type IV secretion system putative lipoprotein virB7 n=4 Tax=Aliivibrio fischeri TaxID=668 RepID=Q5E073_ALIF1|nr:conserved CreA protein [Aliivibrio fischeri ES114]